MVFGLIKQSIRLNVHTMSKNNFSGLTCFNVKSTFSVSELSKEYRFLILESNQKPNYYSKQNFPPNADESGDRSLYLLVKNPVLCFQDVILRNAAILGERFKMQLQIYPGQLHYMGKAFACVKIDTKHTNLMAEIIKQMKILNIELIKTTKTVVPYDTILFYKKHIDFEGKAEDIYYDKENTGRYFFKLKRNIEFDEFEKKISDIKNNCNFHLFDAFLSQLFTNNRVYDFVGIYSEHCDESRLGEFKKHIDKIFS